MSPRRSAAMAQCVQSVQEFLQDSFVPLVAALCSEEAERLARRNNLGFAELLKPFCRLTSEGRYPWGLGGGWGRRGRTLQAGGRRGRHPLPPFPLFFPLPWVCPGCLRVFPSAPWGLGSWASPRGAAKQKVREMGVCKASSPRLGSVKLPCWCLPGACTWSSRSSFSRGKVLCKLSRY